MAAPQTLVLFPLSPENSVPETLDHPDLGFWADENNGFDCYMEIETIGEVSNESPSRLSLESFLVLDERRRRRRELAEELEWEQVDDRIDDPVVRAFHEILGEETVQSHPNVDWEVLFDSPMAEDIVDVSFFNEIVTDFNYPLEDEEYEVLVSRIVENYDGFAMGSPPAAKLAVENLPVVVVDACGVCAVCKDEVSVGEKVKQLPCLHRFHGECILPWLGIRNTCPLCRFELPTDDNEYEQWKAGREDGRGVGDESEIRYDFEVLPEA